jgi:putative membrane protein
MVSTLLSESEAREVEAEVARVEMRTAAEVVVAVLPRSQTYWQNRVVLAVAWGMVAGFAFLHFEPWLAPPWSLVVELVVGTCVFALSGLPAVERLLISRAAAEQATSARAHQLFAERGLHGTRGRTALLIFVSELERRVVLLGDRALSDELGQSGWDQQVSLLLGFIRRGRARDGLLEVLGSLAPHLEAVAPRQPDDRNELPDAVIRS